MEDIRLLALDIDGTILTGVKKLTVRTQAAIEAAADRGIVLALVTGRPLHGLPEELLALRGIRYVITSNGAVTTDLKEGETLRVANLDPETALEVIKVPRSHNLICAAFVDGFGYCFPETLERELKQLQNEGLKAYIRKSRKTTDDLDRVIRQAEKGVENVWFIAPGRSERDMLSRHIRERWNVRTVLTAKTDVEIGSPTADKGLALKELAEQLHIRKEQVMAIGDNGNDLGMLQVAGTAVAMGNAENEVKEIADIVTESNEKDGAAMVIEKLLREYQGIELADCFPHIRNSPVFGKQKGKSIGCP